MVNEDRKILLTTLLVVLVSLIVSFVVVGCSDYTITEPEFELTRGGGKALTIDSLAVLPYESKATTEAGKPLQFCAYAVFGDGRVAMFTDSMSSYCSLLYITNFSVEQRAVSRKQQEIADAL
jgi:hypothetical protein